MGRIKIYKVDTFTSNLFSGNPAAVCPLEHWLPDEVMQSISYENNLSETAFFIKENNKFYIRWFTPEVEIELCGHATLAAAHVIFIEMGFKGNNIEFNTITGDILKVVRNESVFTMNFPSHEPKKSKQNLLEITNALGACPELFLFCNYGFAVFNNEKEIIDITPKFNLLKDLSYNGITVTAPGESVDFVSRFFAPKLGIDEDPVTGSAHCELIPYWSKRLNKPNLIARQLSKRGGEIHCTFLGDRVTMGGSAITYMQGDLFLESINLKHGS